MVAPDALVEIVPEIVPSGKVPVASGGAVVMTRVSCKPDKLTFDAVPVVGSVTPSKTIWSPMLKVPVTVMGAEVFNGIVDGAAEVTMGTAYMVKVWPLEIGPEGGKVCTVTMAVPGVVRRLPGMFRV